ncbi:nucleoporin NUP2 KNAG_0B05630 [Huiozyma naganishii CBS 8797]|uniref:RanBD1 domain-containing protein n=1 Tax=Huiozyma naganishii (strain ATCC MYA-139 / BCRC 22969 / CBS 8797 / KCTC 17520 / NBRC 10181 / NCYC 3082 / Yp74L-3) TaxID=1071383 RepID=J7R2G6_HUIN7|nr:hypothetical protein KNAG_0B05630 [Kazachstania naganishii CBS 8797]CCK68995.1 hypothetical protein KNAG_0B05630 [Kazachstania naganishii CBS 8797]
MSKRFAGNQLTRETYADNSDDERRSEEEAPATVASAEIMNRRKIAMPRRKMEFTAKPVTPAVQSESEFANSFSFGKKPSMDKKSPDANAVKLKALNVQFKSKLDDVVSKDPCADLSSLFDKYKRYLADINSEKTKNSTPSSGVQSTSNSAQSSFQLQPTSSAVITSDSNAIAVTGPASHSSASEGEEEEQKDIKIEGPKFTISTKPITSDSVFAFGTAKKAPSPKEDSDSESDIEIKGPQFTFSGDVKSDIFKLKPKPSVTTEDSNVSEKKTVTFDAAATGPAQETMKEETQPEEKPKFTFGASTNAPAKANPFIFGKGPATDNLKEDKTSEEEKPKPAFSFGAPNPVAKTSGNDSSVPSFTFGAKPKETETSSTKPAFSFGSTIANPTSEKPAVPSSAFSFGSISSSQATTATNTETPEEKGTKPSFSFNFPASNGGKDAQPPASKVTSTPSFAFGSTTKPTLENDGTTATEEKPKPSFSFGSSTTEAKNPPSFVFGKSNDKSEPEEENKKPSFIFGSNSNTTGTNPPSFSFGKPNNNNSSASGGFKFTLPFGQKPATANTEAQNVVETANATNNETTQTPEPVQPAEEETTTQFELQNGEEGETVLFSQRAKLMLFNTETKAYDSCGVGEMKLLQNGSDKTKIRLLCRSDGMGNILLNTAVIKSFNYTPLTPENENLVRRPPPLALMVR